MHVQRLLRRYIRCRFQVREWIFCLFAALCERYAYAAYWWLPCFRCSRTRDAAKDECLANGVTHHSSDWHCCPKDSTNRAYPIKKNQRALRPQTRQPGVSSLPLPPGIGRAHRHGGGAASVQLARAASVCGRQASTIFVLRERVPWPWVLLFPVRAHWGAAAASGAAAAITMPIRSNSSICRPMRPSTIQTNSSTTTSSRRWRVAAHHGIRRLSSPAWPPTCTACNAVPPRYVPSSRPLQSDTLLEITMLLICRSD